MRHESLAVEHLTQSLNLTNQCLKLYAGSHGLQGKHSLPGSHFYFEVTLDKTMRHIKRECYSLSESSDVREEVVL